MLHLQRAKLHTPELTFVALVVEFWVFLPPVWGICSSLPPTSGHLLMFHLSLACGKSQCSIRPTCVASVCCYVLVSCLFLLLSKCLKISQFVGFFSIALVFFSSYLSFPTLVWSCVVGFVYIARFPLLWSFVLWLLFLSFVFSLSLFFCPSPSFSLWEALDYVFSSTGFLPIWRELSRKRPTLVI